MTTEPLWAALTENSAVAVMADSFGERGFVISLPRALDEHVLAEAGALDPAGRPLHRRGVSTTLPGLGYVGLEHQRSFSSATVRGVARDAEYVIDQLIAQHYGCAEPARRAPWRAVRRRCCATLAR